MSGLENQDFPPGWYRVRACVHSKSTTAACLYLTYDEPTRFPQAAILLYPAKTTGQIDQVLMCPAPIRKWQVQFWHAGDVADAVIADVEWTRLSRFAALWYLFTGLRRNAGRSWWVLPMAMGRFAAHIMLHGVRAAAKTLYAHYQDACLGVSDRHDYGRWVELFDADVNVLHAPDVIDSPFLLSLLLPVARVPAHVLQRCIESVRAQTLTNWELCIAADASSAPAIQQLVRCVGNGDPRIQVQVSEHSAAMQTLANEALKMAAGEYVVLLEPEIILRPHSLLEVGKALQRQPGLDFIYSDEDRIDIEGNRSSPCFKPDWNPDLLLSYNYIGNLAVVRRGLALDVGGIHAEDEDCGYHSLFLRCANMLEPTHILHLPKVLCHRCVVSNEMEKRRRARDASRRAIASHLVTICPGVKVRPGPDDGCRVIWPIPDPAPKVSLIIPTRDQAGLVKICVESILQKTRYPNYEIIIVDNQSQEEEMLLYFEKLRQRPDVRVLQYDAPFNYSAINNAAVAATDAEIIGLVNNDIEVISEDWLDEMVGHAIRPGVGAVGAKLYYPDGTLQHAGIVFLWGGADHIYKGLAHDHAGHGGRARYVQNFSAVTAACLVVKRELYLECGGLNEKNLQVAFNDVDFCLRLSQAGYRHVWTPFAELYHHESASRGVDDTPEKQMRSQSEMGYLRQHWAHILDDDPAYNPNLSICDLDAALAFPPRTRI